MLKFIKHHLDTIGGIGFYPALSFAIFFLFFLTMLWWVLTVRRSHIEHMAALPICDEGENDRTTEHAH
jgi:hypothetical protein